MKDSSKRDTIKILGISFFNGDAREAVAAGLGGGLVVVPAAPALVELGRDQAYTDALRGADVVIGDSMFMVILWKLFERSDVSRVSGLTYLKILLKQFRETKERPFWVFPTTASAKMTFDWLESQGLPYDRNAFYVAPFYSAGAIDDANLLDLFQQSGKKQMIICLGGGAQERVGLYMKQNVDRKVGIHCIGAAIGFLTGEQVNIPHWADVMGFGWLFRCVKKPSVYIPRYWKAIELFGIMRRFRSRLPVYTEDS